MQAFSGKGVGLESDNVKNERYFELLKNKRCLDYWRCYVL